MCTFREKGMWCHLYRLTTTVTDQETQHPSLMPLVISQNRKVQACGKRQKGREKKPETAPRLHLDTQVELDRSFLLPSAGILWLSFRYHLSLVEGRESC